MVTRLIVCEKQSHNGREVDDRVLTVFLSCILGLSKKFYPLGASKVIDRVTLELFNMFRLFHGHFLIQNLVCFKIMITRWISHLIHGIPRPLEKTIQVL